MTVPDCIDEYKGLGEEVFGKPRIFSTIRFGLGNRTKYKAARLENVFQRVTEKRNEFQASPDRSITFPSGRGLCKTYVPSWFLCRIYVEANQSNLRLSSC